jgi:flavodoxin/ferredoxin
VTHVKVLILYYSQTGNTAKIARSIAEGVRPLTETCHLAEVKEVTSKTLEEYDLLGLGTPVWMGGFTPNVRSFVESLPDQDGKHIFSFNTHGVMPELYFPGMVRKLKMTGFTVIGWRGWYGSVHFQLAPKPYFTDGHPDEIDCREAEAFGKEMVRVSQQIHAGETELIPDPPDFELTPQLLALLEFYQSGHNPHGQLTRDPEKCRYPRCRTCQENCLMGYIDLSADPPRYGSKGDSCDMWMGCTFCELICPTGAISCDWDQVLEENLKLGEYFGVNPLEAAFKKALESGGLRKLFPDGIQQPYYKVHSRHPRFKFPRQK